MAASEAMSGEERRSILAAALSRGPHSELADTSSDNDDTDIEDQVASGCNGAGGKQQRVGQQLYQLARNSSAAESSSMSLAQQYLLTANDGSNNTSSTSNQNQDQHQKYPHHLQAKRHLKHMLQSIPVPLAATSIITVVILCLLLSECKSFQLAQPEAAPVGLGGQQQASALAMDAVADEMGQQQRSAVASAGVEAELVPESLMLKRELVNGGLLPAESDRSRDELQQPQQENPQLQPFESLLVNPQIVEQQQQHQTHSQRQVLNNLLNHAFSDAVTRKDAQLSVFDGPAETQQQDNSESQPNVAASGRPPFVDTASFMELEPTATAHQLNHYHQQNHEQPSHRYRQHPLSLISASQSLLEPIAEQLQRQHQLASDRDKQHYHRPPRNNDMGINPRLLWHLKYYPRLHEQQSKQLNTQKTLRDVHLEQPHSDYHVKQIECNDTREGVRTFGCPIPDSEGRHKCIVTGSFCNGYLDCPHGEDEDILTCFHYSTLMASIDILTHSQSNLLKKLYRRELNIEQSEQGK